MTRFRQVFSNANVVLPVVHVVSAPQALDNTLIARQAGADGVFLINHDIPYTDLLKAHSHVASAVPDFWIGVNCLDLEPGDVFQHLGPRVAGVWVDNAGIEETADTQAHAHAIESARSASRWTGLYFGGVAFKYQRTVKDVAAAARAAVPFMDVVTTSGPATGQAADPAKISDMRTGAVDAPLALASGITPENLSVYLPFANCFLVATGICRSLDRLDPDRVKALVAGARV